jgi:hypothetical protein
MAEAVGYSVTRTRPDVANAEVESVMQCILVSRSLPILLAVALLRQAVEAKRR